MRTLGEEPIPGSADRVVMYTTMALSTVGIAYGAYRGAKSSPGWAAGGALIGALFGSFLGTFVGVAVNQ